MTKGTFGIRVESLGFAYPDCAPVLEGISFDLAAGSRVLLAGATGSGKSTLLRCLKPELTPEGSLHGKILLDGRSVRELDYQDSAGLIGFVMQDPRQQIVMDTVKAELAFGLENVGAAPEVIERRVAEIAHYFGINAWVNRPTSELSGGEAQLVNLAAILAMKPCVLLLDEPTSMLDPIAARDFLDLLIRVNDELGITILMVEHRYEELLGAMNRILYLSKGSLAFEGEPREFAQWLHREHPAHGMALPVATRLYLESTDCFETHDIPLDVKEGRWWLWQQTKQAGKAAEEQAAHPAPQQLNQPAEPAAWLMQARRVWFRHSKDGAYLLRDVSLEVVRGSIVGIVGANASGKSTLLSLLSGALKPQHGRLSCAKGARTALLPQDPTILFLYDTVLEVVMEHAQSFAYTEEEALNMLSRFGILDFRKRHPLDLSGGEQQKLALSKLLLAQPEVLLLDEPTSRLDCPAQLELRSILRQEAAANKAIVMVSHDLEFVAVVADEGLMLFDGELIGRAPIDEFFADNLFYTTPLRRLVQGIVDDCPGCQEGVRRVCQEKRPPDTLVHEELDA
ncbi:MAG: ATP-binding cassette domain-containing protein [Coriobacteriia bacterium]|nr:ATP-binding cassette domain-containing protein [Coriobacteriia bacterium]